MATPLTIAVRRHVPPAVHAVVVYPQTLRLARHPPPDFYHVLTLYALPLYPILRRGNEPVLIPMDAGTGPPLCGA